ncbi:hypothetical protein, partial [Microvirga aerilata]|uniref:hypothetical protein n=1 Tax=Microvirga aerilata TaxID=670292 RepID=UPI001AEDC71D
MNLRNCIKHQTEFWASAELIQGRMAGVQIHALQRELIHLLRAPELQSSYASPWRAAYPSVFELHGAPMSVLKRNNVKILGRGEQPILFA